MAPRHTRLVRSLALALLLGTASAAVTMAQDGGQAPPPGVVQQQPAQGQAPAPAQNQPQQSIPGEAPAGVGEDSVLATVNGSEIRMSDVRSAAAGLPPQLQQMPAESLIPIVIDQLIAEELLNAEASAAGIDDDPEVADLLQPVIDRLTRQAVLQVWLERHIAEELTEDRLQEEFTAFNAANPQSQLTFEQARPQIEQQVRQQIVQDLVAELRADSDVTIFDGAGAANEPAQQGNPGADAPAGAGDPAANGTPPGGQGGPRPPAN